MPDHAMSALEQLQQDVGKFTIAEAECAIGELITTAAVVPGHRFHTRFFYEIRPLLSIAKHVGASRLIFMGKSACFDGSLFIGEDEIEQKVELTAAIKGYNDALTDELLKERGRAPAFCDIEFSGNKNARTFGENKAKAVEFDTYGEDTLLPLLECAYKKKSDKAETNPANTSTRAVCC